MSIYNNLVFNTNMPLKDSIRGVRVMLVDFSGILDEGHKALFRYSPNSIIIQLKNARLILEGENLDMAHINSDEIYIKGDIKLITREDK